MQNLPLAAQALARGDALSALRLVAHDDQPPSLLVRGIAYAQMGDLDRAVHLLERARAASNDPLLRHRAQAAKLEIDLLGGRAASVAQEAALVATELDALGDTHNAAMQRLVIARAEVLRGRLGEARRTVDEVLSRSQLAHEIRAVAMLAQAENAVRARQPSQADTALDALDRALVVKPNELLERAAASLRAQLRAAVARLTSNGTQREVSLFEIERASNGDQLVVDTCRSTVVAGRAELSFASRPVLFALLRALARSWPRACAREVLISEALGARRANESHRARLRVEIGRLRKVLEGIAEPRAQDDGYVLESERPIALLAPLSNDDAARVSILLADGAAWSARAVAEHLGVSIRTAQRALSTLVETGGARRFGAARDVTYAGSRPAIASRLLLLALLSTP